MLGKGGLHEILAADFAGASASGTIGVCGATARTAILIAAKGPEAAAAEAPPCPAPPDRPFIRASRVAV
jgi:hypothetical protein